MLTDCLHKLVYIYKHQYNINKSNITIPSQHHFIVTCDPSEIFQTYSSDLCDAFEGDPLRIVNGFISSKLISPNLRNDITSMSGRAYDKASKIIQELQRQMDSDKENSTQYLERICLFLQGQKDTALKKIGEKMNKELII